VKAALPETAAGKPLEIWFQDEARVGQQGSLEYVWAPIGSRPLAVRDNRHHSVYLFGAVCPTRGTGAAIIMPAANSEAMSERVGAQIGCDPSPHLSSSNHLLRTETGIPKLVIRLSALHPGFASVR